jgi:hypothetical protein
MAKRSMDDFNANNRLKAQLLRAEERIRELEAAQKPSSSPATAGSSGVSAPTVTIDPPQRAK